MKTILVLGGTGKTGRHVVEKLIENNFNVRVLTRDVTSAHRKINPRAELIQGDLIKTPDFSSATEGIDAVIAAQGADGYPDTNGPELIDYRGVEKIIKSIKGNQVHFVLMSAIYVTRKEHEWNKVGGPIYWKAKSEDMLRKSNLPYSIVRASWLTNANLNLDSISAEQGDKGDGKISREAVAEVLVHCIMNRSALKKTFELYEKHGKQFPGWETFFQILSTDK
jgi:uncharacterized protein YbjT (DUF2867 family)